MKIRVEDIRENQELIVQDDIPVSEWEIDNVAVKFLDKIQLSGKASRISKEILLDISVHFCWMITCCRCLEDVKQDMSQNYTPTYDVDKLGEYIDVDKDVREEILLNFPAKLLCSERCKGLCVQCGANLNKEKCKCCKGG